MSCNICISNYNKSTKTKIICNYCNYDSCKECTINYILNFSNKKSANCMSCHKDWNYNFLYSIFTKKFINTDYKKHIENFLFDTEKSLLPSTQDDVNNEILFENNILEIKKIEAELKIKKLDFKLQKIKLKYEVNQKIKLDIKNKKTLKLQYKEKINNLSNDIDQLQDNLFFLKETKIHEHKTNYIRHCPNNNCNGFLNNVYHCTICNTYVCSKCNTLKKSKNDDSHICKQEDIDVVDMIKKECKNCPKCNISIFKIDGCDQMFCTICHIAFDWKSGKEIKHNILHNPHFFEWQRQNNITTVNNNNDDNHILCDQYNINIINLINLLISFLDVDTHKYLYDIYIYSQEIREYIINMPFIENIEDKNKDLRIKFLRNLITELDFKKLLYKRDKNERKLTDKRHVYSMYSDVLIQILYKFYLYFHANHSGIIELTNSIKEDFEHKIDIEDDYHLSVALSRERDQLISSSVNDIFKSNINDIIININNMKSEIVAIIKYTNSCLTKIKNDYNCVVDYIKETGRVYDI
jgi:hypothetical protein